MITNEDLEAIAQSIGALAHESRLRIVIILSHHQEITTSQLGRILSLKDATVSHHLAPLVQSGMVNRRRSGKYVFYFLNKQTWQALLGALSSLFTEDQDANSIGTD